MIKEFPISKDNQKIYGLLYLPDDYEGNPENQSNKKYPLVILSHGLSLNHTYMKPYAEKLQKYGIASFIFDFRGGGYGCLSSGKISDMSIFSEIEDLNNVVSVFKEFDLFSSLYLAGHSQGGLISSLAAANKESIIKGLFLFAPAYVIVDDVKETINKRDKNVLNLMPEYLGKTYIDSVNAIDLYEDMSNYNNPVYIFHGKKDSRVPLECVKEACGVYKNHELIVYEGQGHRFSDAAKEKAVKTIAEVIGGDF